MSDLPALADDVFGELIDVVDGDHDHRGAHTSNCGRFEAFGGLVEMNQALSGDH